MCFLRGVAFGEGGTNVLGVFGYLAYCFGGETSGAIGKSMNFANVGMGCGSKGHGFGGWSGFGCIVVGLRCEGFGDIGGSCYDEAGGHGRFGDEGG